MTDTQLNGNSLNEKVFVAIHLQIHTDMCETLTLTQFWARAHLNTHTHGLRLLYFQYCLGVSLNPKFCNSSIHCCSVCKKFCAGIEKADSKSYQLIRTVLGESLTHQHYTRILELYPPNNVSVLFNAYNLSSNYSTLATIFPKRNAAHRSTVQNIIK